MLLSHNSTESHMSESFEESRLSDFPFHWLSIAATPNCMSSRFPRQRKEQCPRLHIFSYRRAARSLRKCKGMQMLQVKDLQWGPVGGSPRDQAGLQTDRLLKLVSQIGFFLRKSDFDQTCLPIGCFVHKSTLPGLSRSQQAVLFTFQEAFSIECASSGRMHTILGAPQIQRAPI